MTDINDDIQRERATPERVVPLEYDGIRYEAEELSPADAMVNTGTDHVRAYDSATGTLLWDIALPSSVGDSGKEEDKQWNFITNLSVIEGVLVVTNEQGDIYHVDPKTGALL